MLDKETIIDKFALQTKTISLESIEGEVKIKKLTVAQRQEVNDILFGDAKVVGASRSVEVEVARYNKAAKLAVSYGLVEPKLSMRDIEKLSEDANEFIMEVFNAIQEFDEPKK